MIDNILELSDFKRQVDEVKIKLPDYEPELIEDVLRHHIKTMAMELQKVRPWKRRIYIHSWAFIEVFPWCFNPYSRYYDRNVTERKLRKFKKELEQIKITKNG